MIRKSTGMSWPGQAARMLGYMYCFGNMNGVFFEDTEVEGFILCKATLKEDETA
jgi:hypothetical protein